MLDFILILLLAGCAAQPAIPRSTAEGSPVTPESSATAPAALNIFAAASLSEAFGEIGKMYEASHPGVTVVFNFAGSQQLARQINEGAPADVFASASDTQMNAVIGSGAVASGAQKIFAQNRLVVIYPQDNPGGLRELGDLAKPGLKLVFATQEVPVGEYSIAFLDKASVDSGFGPDFKEHVLGNVVSYEDNVKVVLAKVALGEADAGIVYASDLSGASADRLGEIDIPEALNVTASYPIAPVRESRHADLAQDFIDLVLSPAGQDVLAEYHFIPVR